MTKQSLEACVCVQKCGVRYHLATHYSRHKKANELESEYEVSSPLWKVSC